MRRFFVGLAIFFVAAAGAAAQQQAVPPGSMPPPTTPQSAAFLQAADQVLAQMSKLLSLPILSPLKKSIRSREEIRAYLLRQEQEDKNSAKRYADQKTMEKFGLLPKNYPLEQTLLKVLTEQIAGLYDPKGHEFLIADWINPADQRMVMAHELTHALMDQHFHIEKWTDAAKPDDDAELARDAVIEGSAIAAMLDYKLNELGDHLTVRNLPDIDPSLLMGDPDTSPVFSKAPKIIQDSLLFPYLAGTKFTQDVLKATNGWPNFYKVFQDPPVSTQQIMHPELYFAHVQPPKITLPETKGVIPTEWKKLDENKMGEFGVLEVMKQFLSKNRATNLAASWSSDRYAIFENQKDKRTLLLFQVRLASDAEAASFFGGYRDVLKRRYDDRKNPFEGPNFFSFNSPDGGVFLRCFAADCMVLDGGTRPMFDRLTRELRWPAIHAVPAQPGKAPVRTVSLPAIATGAGDSRQIAQPWAN